MKNYLLSISTSVAVFALTFASNAGQLSSDVEQYKDKVQALQAGAANPAVKAYLESCLAGASLLKGLEAYDAHASDAFKKLVNDRTSWPTKLSHQDRLDPAIPAETAAYDKHLWPYREAEYVNLIRLQDDLFERKYFQTETSKSANIIEGALNNHWSLTRGKRGDPTDVLALPTLGVSPWEAILRFEPTLVFDNGAQGAIMGTFGMTRAFFPTVQHTTNGATFSESSWSLSKTVQKIGLRAGVGAGKLDDKTKLLLGVGVQVWSVGVWGLYEPKDSTFLLGVSMSDLSKVKKVVGWFD